MLPWIQSRHGGNISLVRPAGLDGFHACFRFGSGLIHRAIAHHSYFRRRGLRFSDCALPGLRVPERQNKSRQTPGPQLQ